MSTVVSYEPKQLVDILLENVQRCFTRRISGITDINYWDTLKELKLYSMERRRERYCIIYVLKMLHELVPNFSCGEIKEYPDDKKGILCKITSLIRRATQQLQPIQEGTFWELRYRGDPNSVTTHRCLLKRRNQQRVVQPLQGHSVAPCNTEAEKNFKNSR